MGHPGHRLHAGPDRLARAHPGGGALPAHVRPQLVLHRGAEGGRGARADDARRPHRGDARLPLHPDRRRGAPRAVLQPLLRAGGRARGGLAPGPAHRDERAREPRVQRALRRDAEESRRRTSRGTPRTSRSSSRRSRSTTWSSRGCSPSRASTSSSSTTRSRARCRASWRASTRSRATSTATWPSARASCARWPRRTRRYGEAITRTLAEVAPIADAVLRPKWYVEGETQLFGTDLEETRAFAAKALERRLKVIGLAPVAYQGVRPP